MKTKRFTKNEVVNNQSYQMPKFLFDNNYNLSSTEILLYTFLLDDEYSEEELMKLLNCSRYILKKSFKTLENQNLIVGGKYE